MNARLLRLLLALLRVLFVAATLVISVTPSHAGCRTTFITVDGKTIICTVCDNMTWCNPA